MYRGLLAASAAIVVIACPVAARADALGDARKAVDGSDYPSAKTSLQAALEAGKANPTELAEIYKLTGIVEGALNNTQAATSAFAKWLSLEPKASLPPGTSPKFMRPFEAAQQQAAKRGAVEAKAETQDEPPVVTLVIGNDPHKLIAGAKVYFRVDKRAEQALAGDIDGGKVTIELETGKRIDLRLHAVDAYGNRVLELGTKDVPLVITSSGKTKVIIDPKDADLVKKHPRAATEVPWYATWWVWGIATGVSAGVTGFFGWRTKVAVDDLDTLNANSYVHRWSEAQTVEDRAHRNMLITNIGLGVTGAFALGTVIFFLARPDDVESAPRAAITPIPGGGAVVLGGQF